MALEDWGVKAEQQTREEVERLVRMALPTDGLGILGKRTPGVDLDIRDADLVQKVAALAHTEMGWTVERIGQPPKLLLPYRCVEPFESFKSREFRLPGDDPEAKRHRIEIIAAGGQWVAYHDHPGTGRPYVWPEGDLPAWDELPEITEAKAREFVAKAEDLIHENGGIFTGEKCEHQHQPSSGWGPVGDYDAIASALAAIPNEGADVPWEIWNRVAMATKAALGDEGWPLFLAWSRRSAKFEPKNTSKLWAGIKREQLHTVGAQTIYGLGRDHGWVPPADVSLNPNKRADVKHGAEIARRIIEAHQRRKAQAQEDAQEARGERVAGTPDFDEQGPEEPGGVVPGEGAGKSTGTGTAGDVWLEPVDLFSEHFPTAITVDETCMPTVLLRFARAEGARLGVDPAGLATLAAGACSGVISDDWKIRLKQLDSWSEAPRLWIAIVSAPGTKKTDQVRSVKRPIDTLEHEMRKQWGKDLEAHERELQEWNKQKGDDKGEKPQPPPEPRISFQDGTVEALSEILSNGTEKLLLIQDELTVMFGSFDRYNSGKGGAQRGHWLKLYDGGVNRIDRVNRGNVYVPNWSTSIVGGIQPEKLRKLMGDLTDDGMLQRFAVVYPDFRITGDPEDDDKAPDAFALVSYETVVRALRKLAPQQRDGGGRLTVCAGEGVQEERRRLFRLVERIEADPTLPVPLKEAVSKWRGLSARIALVFHLIRYVSKETPCAVTVEASTVRMAANFLMRVIAPSTFRLFRQIGLDGSEHVRWMAGYILAHGTAQLSARDIGRVYRELRGDDAGILQTMVTLEHAGWCKSDNHPKRPKWAINPEVHSRFAVKAEEERKRREQTRELIKRKIVEFTA